MRSYFTFAGKSSLEYHLRVERCPRFVTGSRGIEKQSVPGRNGDLLLDTGVYGNYIQPYEVWFRDPDALTIPAARTIALWLMGSRGYQRLEDTYDPEVFRLACYGGPLDVENWMLTHGRATLEFDCKPQRYLKAGETPVAITSGQTLTNLYMPALPLIQITGAGEGRLQVGSSNTDITGMEGTMTLDCDIQDAYSGTLNCNNKITVSGGWPRLEPGQTAISFSGGITAVTITPRWWTL